MTDVRLDNVRVAYGGHDIVRNVSFTDDSGELAAVVGGSGSGKTSLLRAIAGYAPVVAGRMPALVYVIEPLGHNVLVDLCFGEQIIRARGDWENERLASLQPDDQVHIRFGPTQIHVLDRASGRRLEREGEWGIGGDHVHDIDD